VTEDESCTTEYESSVSTPVDDIVHVKAGDSTSVAETVGLSSRSLFDVVYDFRPDDCSASQPFHTYFSGFNCDVKYFLNTLSGLFLQRASFSPLSDLQLDKYTVMMQGFFNSPRDSSNGAYRYADIFYQYSKSIHADAELDFDHDEMFCCAVQLLGLPLAISAIHHFALYHDSFTFDDLKHTQDATPPPNFQLPENANLNTCFNRLLQRTIRPQNMPKQTQVISGRFYKTLPDVIKSLYVENGENFTLRC